MTRTLTALALTLAATPAFAHLPPGEYGSFLAGVTHPIFGLDHVLAMVAVGLWAAQIGGRSVWGVPTAFVATMIAGFLLALAGLPLPFVEPAILTSIVVLGLVVALALRPDPRLAMALVGAFALFHGHAHGGELGGASALQFGAGFAIATALLHAAGLGVAVAASRLTTGNAPALRLLGGLTSAAGLYFIFG
ncbi:HupE/UreJ family protein [Roseovarius sp.]|uniref:HupE/UreJ family protein n=1 Tax=Roseovarius sp. TaxID=1486281 RepID=UPI002613D100|nr:HupE/UreJ family protein [Roseovarius sp.]MDM8164858.1 HupE/UreJ family protein [Roseovarius sp.]